MTDSLRELVNARDKAANEPKALRRLARSESMARRICVVCRKLFDEWADRGEWRQRMEIEHGPLRSSWPMYAAPETCACGGQLVEVA